MNSKSYRRNRTIAVIIILCAVFSACFFLFKKILFVDYIPETYAESPEKLANPYIGFYSMYGYMLSDTTSLTLPDETTVSKADAGLVLLEINLKNYADRDLTAACLSQLDLLLSAWQNTGSQMILRFLYDWDGNNLMTEPQNRSQILQHMQQISEIVNKHRSSVFLLQGIFVGNWGEMNNTDYMAEEDMTVLLNQLAASIDPSIFLSVRTPAQLRLALNSDTPLSSSQAFNGTLPARLGLFNDGMLGSESDTGTYSSSFSLSREEEIAFQNSLCHYVPNGGEVIIDNPLNDFDQALADLSAMHVSYLNKDYDQTVLQKWKSTTYNGSDTIYHNISGYDYIERHLGYRYVLEDSKLSYSCLSDHTARLSFSLKNVGFSSCYRPLDICVTLVSESGNILSIPVDTDLRFLHSNTSKTLNCSLPMSDLNRENYNLYLKITAPSLDREILLANTMQHTEYGYLFASVSLSKLPK